MLVTCVIRYWVLCLAFLFLLNIIWICVRDLLGILIHFVKHANLTETLKRFGNGAHNPRELKCLIMPFVSFCFPVLWRDSLARSPKVSCHIRPSARWGSYAPENVGLWPFKCVQKISFIIWGLSWICQRKTILNLFVIKVLLLFF